MSRSNLLKCWRSRSVPSHAPLRSYDSSEILICFQPVQPQQKGSVSSPAESDSIAVTPAPGPTRTISTSKSPSPDSQQHATVPTKQIAPRPDLQRHDDPLKDPSDYIKSIDYVKEKNNDRRLMLHRDLPMIVRLEDGWNEIWCHVCGANASSRGNAADGVVPFQGVYGLHCHIASMHGVAGKKTFVKDLWKICGRYLLSEKEVRKLRQWKVTVKIQSSGSNGLRGKGKAELPAPAPAANDVGDEEIMNEYDSSDEEDAVAAPGYLGHILQEQTHLTGAVALTNHQNGFTPVNGNTAISTDSGYGSKSSPTKRAAESETSSVLEDSGGDGVAERVKRHRRTETPRRSYTDHFEYGDMGEETF